MLSTVFIATIAITCQLVHAAIRPAIPRWIDADRFGFGYEIKKLKKDDSISYQGYLEFSYDFDYNCAREFWLNYIDHSWGERTTCQGETVNFFSNNNTCTVKKEPFDIENEINRWVNKFGISHGAGYTDPIWRRDDYHLLEHNNEETYIYMRTSDKAIEFIVDSNTYGVDNIIYFPSGIDWDKSARGVWDYKMKYSKCPAENKRTFF